MFIEYIITYYRAGLRSVKKVSRNLFLFDTEQPVRGTLYPNLVSYMCTIKISQMCMADIELLQLYCA